MTFTTSTEHDWEVLRSAFAEEAAACTGVGDPDSAEYWAMVADVEATLAGVPPPGLASQELLDGLAMASRGLGRASLGEQEAAQVFEGALGEAMEAAGRVRTQLDAVTVSVALEAAQRGLHTSVGLSLVDWLRVRCPWLSTTEAGQIQAVVTCASTPWGVALREAVRTGQVALHRGARVARTMTRLAPSLDVDQREAFTSIAVGAAANPGLSDRDLGVVCAELVRRLLEEKEPGERERAAHEQRNVTSRCIGEGLTRFVVDAPDAQAATLEGILTGALAAPTPAEDGTPDPRTAGQRRFDALMSVLERGLGNPGAAPSTARASVILIVPFDTETGRPSGPARTPTGQLVDERGAELLSCSADLTPVWLSAEGEPLRLGRTARYASPGQWKALVVRDGHCTFPGCSQLPQWCDTHHLQGWAREHGLTDVDKMVLLCQTHHTFVHLHNLIAQIIGGVVLWHL